MSLNPKISIITVCFNSEKYIQDTIDSVLDQTYKNIEYIIIDGNSTDSTMQIVTKYGNRISKVVSEPDDGIYDAMNIGIDLASGDYIGILNSDDYLYNSNVVEKMVQYIVDKNPEIVLSDSLIVKRDDEKKIHRYYKSNSFKRKHIEYGIMPPHNTIYIKSAILNEIGKYDTSFRMSADFDLVARLIYRFNKDFLYIPVVFSIMRDGGISSSGMRSKIKITRDIIRSCKVNKVKTNYFKILSRFIYKSIQLFMVPKM